MTHNMVLGKINLQSLNLLEFDILKCVDNNDNVDVITKDFLKAFEKIS